MSKRLIGYGYTNANGVATLDYDAEGNELQSSGYVGQGVGNVDISASAVIDGSTFVSGTYPVIDGTYCDSRTSTDVGTKNNHNNNITMDYQSDGTLASNSSGNRGYIMFNQTQGDSASYPFTPSFCIEFDIVSHTNSPYIVLTGINKYWGLTTDNSHVKIELHSDGTITGTINNTAISTTFTVADVSIRFQLENGDAVKYKNFVVYPI